MEQQLEVAAQPLVRVPKSPDSPTTRELEEHEATGCVVYRSWCPHCVRARATVNPHWRSPPEEEHAVPTILMDYMFMGQDDGKSIPILAMKDKKSKTPWCYAVPTKGVHEYAVACCMEAIRETGYRRLIFKSDDEHSIVALKMQVIKTLTDVEIVPQESPTGDHQANGEIECMVRELKGQIRAIKSRTEEKLGTVLADGDPLLLWMPRHAGFLMAKLKPGLDGRTPHQRLTGKAWRRPMITYGEKIYFRPIKSYMSDKANDFESKIIVGRYIGTQGRNADVLAITDDGVIRGTSVHRRPEQERWDTTDLDKLKGLPWNRRPHEREMSELPLPISLPPMELPPVEAKDREFAPRRVYIKRTDIEQFGMTVDCPGCEAMITGGAARMHNPACRSRIEEELGKTLEGQKRIENAQARGSNKSGIEARPDPAAGAVAAGEALGIPMEDAKPRGNKRQGESIEDMEEEALKQMIASDEAATAAAAAPVQPATGASDAAMGSLAYGCLTSMTTAAGKLQERKLLDINNLEAVVDMGYLQQGIVLTEPEKHDISKCLCDLGYGRGDISEIFSPPRLAAQAQVVGLRGGFSIDLGTRKRDGTEWDLGNDLDIERVKTMQDDEDPYLLTGSPPCEAFSNLQNLNKGKVDPAVRQKRLKQARKHLKTSVMFYKRQMERDKYFLHEHPQSASSWYEEEIKELQETEGVYCVEGPMCRWHMKSEDAQGEGYVRKQTKWLTNSKVLADILDGECSNKKGNTWHRHVQLINGRASEAKVYPPMLVKAILKGIRKQLEEDGEMQKDVCGVGPVPEEAIHLEEENFYTDDTTGAYLETPLVEAARKEELDWVKKQGTYKVVSMDECWKETGKPPVTLKWIDINKGDEENPRYRSRLVAREIKKKGQRVLPDHQLFSSMPPLEAMKILGSKMVTVKVSKPRRKPLKLKLYDISRAHLYGVAKRKVYVTLPMEEHEEGKCGLLEKSMYGTQDAAAIWQDDYSVLLIANGFKRGVSSASVFYNEELDMRCLVHGDDFLCLGDDEAQATMEKLLAQKYDYKIVGGIGPDSSDGEEMCVLNRTLRFNKYTGVLTYEADQRHAELIVRELGLESAKPVSTPHDKKNLEQIMQDDKTPVLTGEDVTKYRSLTMRASYLSQDRSDICDTVKILARKMKEPNEADMGDLKRLGRFLKGKPRVVITYRPQKFYKGIDVYVDSDHAGCLRTRKSTSGVMVMLGGHCVKGNAGLQSTISLSSGESEYYGIVKGAAIGLQIQSLLADWGYTSEVKVHTDSTAAKGTCSRRGLGKLRHVQTRYLWVQERVANEDIKILKVGTHDNIADMCTKSLSAEVSGKFMKKSGQVYTEGRATTAKQLVS